MINFTKEQLIASAHARIEFAEMMLAGELEPLKERTWSIELELARIALASLEAEPVAYIIQDADARSSGEKGILRYFANISDEDINEYQITVTPLYTAPPAPVSVPDDNAITQHFDTIALEVAREIMCDVNRRHEFLGGEVQLLSRIQCRIDDACRAAMLQGAENAKLPTTMQTAPDLDSSQIIAESPSGKSPVIPDGWALVPVEPTDDMIVNGFESEPDEGFSDEKEWEAYDAMSGCQQAAHRAKLCWSAMISAAPKPDVR